MKYDAIIAGASFAGLAAASRLKGKILIIDQNDIGSRQTSACATLLRVPQNLGCQDSVLQIHNEGYIHLRSRTIRHILPQAFCTFDFSKFCQGLFKLCNAEFVKAKIFGVKDGQIKTSRGDFEAKCVIDATGWRAVLASSLENSYVVPSEMSFGLDVAVPKDGSGASNPGLRLKNLDSGLETGLHFWVDPVIAPKGYGWFFPSGDYYRAGIGSYNGSKETSKTLEQFLDNLGVKGRGVHGGFFPWVLRRPVVGQIFVVGDAAGQCLPITGEGIRSAVFFGQACGDIVQNVIEGRVPLSQGLQEYESLVNGFKGGYNLLRNWQLRLSHWPYFLVFLLYAATALRPVSRSLLSRYVFLNK